MASRAPAVEVVGGDRLVSSDHDLDGDAMNLVALVRKGAKCTYCVRPLSLPTKERANSATRDHIVPKVMGGEKRVICCRQCNNLKGDILPDDWHDFIRENPQWWLTFRTNKEVRLALPRIPSVQRRREQAET